MYGPRFAVYSAIRQLPDGRPFLDLAESLVEDANVIDRLCRLAAADYRAWCDGSRDRSTRPAADLPFALRVEAPR